MRLTESNSHIGVAMSVMHRIDLPSKDVHIKTYSNCREQGLHIISYLGKDVLKRKAVSVSENRSSDDIVVIFGMQDDFDDSGVMKSEELWETNRKYLAYKDFEGAAKFIAKYFKK
jgi:hypothetical protein